MKAVLLLDYATFNFDAGSVDALRLNSLCADTDLHFKKIGLSDNSPLVSPFGVSYLHNSGYSERPHRVQFSGVGCAHFEACFPAIRDLGNNHCSRVDFAFDIPVKKYEWKEFISSAFRSSLDSDRSNKKIVLSGTGEAMTVYIGSRKCAKFCRIYNKSLEDKSYSLPSGESLADDEYIIRYELELKRFKGRNQDFDPSYLLDAYFNEQQFLIDYILDVWRLYGEDYLFPSSLSDLELSCRFSTEYKFCSNSDLVSFVNDRLYELRNTYDSTVEYVASRFGKYIPFIVADPILRNICIQACESYSGFKIEIVCSCSESGFYDLDFENESEVLKPQQEIWESESSYSEQLHIESL